MTDSPCATVVGVQPNCLNTDGDTIEDVGEIGLGGELRQVHRTERRLAEAARLGFTRAVVPRSAPDAPPGMRLGRASSIADAIHHQAFQPSAV